MNAIIARRVTRIGLYFRQVCEDMRRNDPVQGMDHAAELTEQCRRLYTEFESEARRRRNVSDE